MRILLMLTGLIFGFRAQAQMFDLYEASKKDAPILIFVHGGAWVTGDKSDYRVLGRALASSRICVAVVNYKLSTLAKHPEPVHELDRAIRDVSKLKSATCNTRRIFLSGHSAGAHMIAFWDSAFTNSLVRGFVGLEGIYDIPNLVKRWPAYKDQFIAAEFGASSAWPAASPTRLKMKSKTPWLVIHSAQDELVDLPQSQDFEKHLTSLGIPVQSVVLHEGNHFGVMQELASKRDSDVAKAVTGFVR